MSNEPTASDITKFDHGMRMAVLGLASQLYSAPDHKKIKAILKTMISDVCAETQAFIYRCGFDGDYIGTDVKNFDDAIDNAFEHRLVQKGMRPVNRREVISSIAVDSARAS